ncbi:MAG: DUF3794 and LysM peptidoglycan-binding domain-containing protein [Christensenellales bacterium]|jgi:hypothetical protein
MKVQKTSLQTETADREVLSESLIEGRLSLPSDKADIDRILFIQGRAHVMAEPTDGRIFMDGSVVFSVVYISADGDIESFEASSPFRHSEEMPGAGAGMTVFARGNVRDIEYSADDSHSVYVKGIVSVSLRGIMPKSIETVSDAGEPSLQVKMASQPLAVTRDIKRDTLMMREDVRIPQNMPMAVRILFADAYPVVKLVHAEDARIVVEGELKITALYISEDRGAPLQQLTESVPFGQIIPADNLEPNDNVTADANLMDFSLNTVEDAGDILRLSARINLLCTARTYREAEYMEDAYSLSNRLDVAYADQCCRQLKRWGCVRTFARSSISIPSTQPGVSRVVCFKASPVILALRPGEGRVYIEGLMMFTMCYTSPDGVYSHCGEVPFEAEALLEGISPGDEIEVNADVESAICEGTGRDISVKFMLDVALRTYCNVNIRLVTDLKDTGEPNVRNTGITIYFADGGESTWDIAKRYATTPDNIKRFNPDMGDSVAPGQKVLIF